MIILRYPRCPGMAAGALSLIKSHDIVILSFCNIVKGQAKCISQKIINVLNICVQLDTSNDGFWSYHVLIGMSSE